MMEDTNQNLTYTMRTALSQMFFAGNFYRVMGAYGVAYCTGTRKKLWIAENTMDALVRRGMAEYYDDGTSARITEKGRALTKREMEKRES
jgi:hypothetical protein